MSEYTPTTEEVRADYIDGGWGPDGSLYGDNDSGQFDRWLAGVKAQAWEEGAAHVALACGVIDDATKSWLDDGDNPYREVVE
jgi:hypothetical protein